MTYADCVLLMGQNSVNAVMQQDTNNSLSFRCVSGGCSEVAAL
jgi:hypothetical protein